MYAVFGIRHRFEIDDRRVVPRSGRVGLWRLLGQEPQAEVLLSDPANVVVFPVLVWSGDSG